MNATALSMTCNNLLLPIVQITTIALLIAQGMYNELFDTTIWPNIISALKSLYLWQQES